MKWAPIGVSGRTTLFEKININFGSTLTPYDVSSEGREIDRLLINSQSKLLRMKNFYLTTGLDFGPKPKTGDKTEKAAPSWGVYDDYEVFSGTWAFRADYSFNVDFTTYNKDTKQFSAKYRQDVRIGGSLAPTKNWRINYTMAYDITENQFQAPQFSFYRDLHCWEASMSVVPFGNLKSYTLKINIKSALFQGVEYKKERSRYD